MVDYNCSTQFLALIVFNSFTICQARLERGSQIHIVYFQVYINQMHFKRCQWLKYKYESVLTKNSLVGEHDHDSKVPWVTGIELL